MSSTRHSARPPGCHCLPVHPVIRANGVRAKKLPELIIDEPMIKPVMKATDLRAVLFGDIEMPAKRLRHWAKQDYDRRQIHEEMEMEYREIEVPGENLRVRLPRGVVCHRLEHHGFEYLLYLDGSATTLKFFEKRFL